MLAATRPRSTALAAALVLAAFALTGCIVVEPHPDEVPVLTLEPDPPAETLDLVTAAGLYTGAVCPVDDAHHALSLEWSSADLARFQQLAGEARDRSLEALDQLTTEGLLWPDAVVDDIAGVATALQAEADWFEALAAAPDRASANAIPFPSATVEPGYSAAERIRDALGIPSWRDLSTDGACPAP